MHSTLHGSFRRLWILCALFLGMSTMGSASHFTGWDITYSCIGPNQYQVTVNIYRDCNGVALGNTQIINYSSASCGISSSVTLTRQSVADITPLCPTQPSACGGSGPIGIELHTYQGTLTLPSACSDWVLSASSCCRNRIITNLNNPSSAGIYVSTTLDNTSVSCNNSPSFASNPQLFACVNQPVNYQQLAFDADGDSLVYSMTDCRTAANSTVSYASGFSGTNPLTSPINLNPQTGDIRFTVTQPQVAVMCVLVQEYRNGVLIGTITRDIQFNITNCTNTIPDLTGIDGSSTVFDTTICAGALLCFDINVSDVNNGQNLNLTYSNTIPGATFTTTGSGTNLVGRFCWNTGPNDFGTHVFSITARDDACPIVGQNTQSYIVNVRQPQSPRQCGSRCTNLCRGNNHSNSNDSGSCWYDFVV